MTRGSRSEGAPPPSTTVRGAEAESLAVEFLERTGYRIEKRNHRCAVGEIDIVAFDGDVLCFIEVRSLTNPEYGDPLETIGPKKIRRVIKAAQSYIDELPGPWPEMRFDAVGILLTQPPEITLIRGACDA